MGSIVVTGLPQVDQNSCITYFKVPTCNMLTIHLKIKNKIYHCNYQLSKAVLPNATSKLIILFPHLQEKQSPYNHLVCSPLLILREWRTKFPKPGYHYKIMGTRMVIWSQFHTDDSQLWNTTVQNLVTMAACCPGLALPCSKTETDKHTTRTDNGYIHC